jgi:hypothetical protein
MRMRMVGFNYVKFLIKVRKRFSREQDGEFISAQIYSPKKNCWFTTAELDLSRALHQMRNKGRSKLANAFSFLGFRESILPLFPGVSVTEEMLWSLPYEIIVVGVYDDEPKECGDE